MSSRPKCSSVTASCAAALVLLTACSTRGVSTNAGPDGLPGQPSPIASARALGPSQPRTPSDESSGDTSSAVCALVDPEVVGTIVGAPVTSASAADTACVYTTADSQESVEILRLPSSVLAEQLSRRALTPVAGVGDKAYWSAADATLFAVKAHDDLAVQATLSAAGPAVERACVAIATAALQAL